MAPSATTGPALAPVNGSAVFSDDGHHRFLLERRWDDSLPSFTYILLNPSVADADHDDPTVARLLRLTRHNGGGRFVLVNLFSVVDTFQQRLHLTGERNDRWRENREWVADALRRPSVLVVGWGDGRADDKTARGRRSAVRCRAEEIWPLIAAARPHCFRTLRSGAPGHPGRLRGTSRIRPYRPPPPTPGSSPHPGDGLSQG